MDGSSFFDVFHRILTLVSFSVNVIFFIILIIFIGSYRCFKFLSIPVGSNTSQSNVVTALTFQLMYSVFSLSQRLVFYQRQTKKQQKKMNKKTKKANPKLFCIFNFLSLHNCSSFKCSALLFCNEVNIFWSFQVL